MTFYSKKLHLEERNNLLGTFPLQHFCCIWDTSLKFENVFKEIFYEIKYRFLVNYGKSIAQLQKMCYTF